MLGSSGPRRGSRILLLLSPAVIKSKGSSEALLKLDPTIVCKTTEEELPASLRSILRSIVEERALLAKRPGFFDRCCTGEARCSAHGS